MLKVMLSFHRNNQIQIIQQWKNSKCFPDVILNFKAELAQYLGLADGVAKVDLLDWWIKKLMKITKLGSSIQDSLSD